MLEVKSSDISTHCAKNTGFDPPNWEKNNQLIKQVIIRN